MLWRLFLLAETNPSMPFSFLICLTVCIMQFSRLSFATSLELCCYVFCWNQLGFLFIWMMQQGLSQWEKTCLIDAPGSFGDFYVWAPPAYIMFWTLLLWMYQDPGHLTLYGITLLDFLLFCEYVLSFSVQNSQYRSPWYLFKFPGESVAMETMLVVW